MNIALERSYRLVTRRGMGLACDKDGVALGAADLVRVRPDARGARRCEVRPVEKVGQILRAAYGAHPDEVVLHLHRGLHRVASSIEAGDLCLAGIGAVLLGFPDLKPGAMAKLAEIADFEKDGAAWENEARVPLGQAGGGQWTAGGGGASTAGDRPAGNSSHAEAARPERPALPLDDGVYRPGADDPFLIHVGGATEEDEESRGSNFPPPDFTPLYQVFPILRDNPALVVPLAPLDHFFGISGSAEGVNAEITNAQYRFLLSEIKAIDPKFVNQELMPTGGIDGMSWQGRDNLINGLQMQLAATYYRVRGDIRLLQRETFNLLQKAADKYYAEGVKEFDAGRLKSWLSREEAIGNYMDPQIRAELRASYNASGVNYGPSLEITVNNRDYDTSGPKKTYTVPDARVRDMSFDWTLTEKTISFGQIRGFFSADSRPLAVVIVRPSQLGPNSTYLIRRPTTLRPWR
jgi:hypothetical protein